MKNSKVIELFTKRKSIISKIQLELDGRTKVIEDFTNTDDPDILLESVSGMLNSLTKVSEIDKEILTLIGNDMEVFSLYNKLVKFLVNEEYEEAGKIKNEIDKRSEK